MWLRRVLAIRESDAPRGNIVPGVARREPRRRFAGSNWSTSFEGGRNGRTISQRDPDHELRLSAQGMGAVRWAAAAHQPEPGALLAAGHDLRRRRPGELRRCPNLQGRAPIHMGSGHTLGERGGEQAHTLSISEIPTHVHAAERARAPTATTARSDHRRFLAHGTAATRIAPPTATCRAWPPARSQTSAAARRT